MSENIINLRIEGMSSQGCVNIITNLIIDERGVEKVEVSLEKSTATVTGSYKLNSLQIINAINSSNLYYAKQI